MGILGLNFGKQSGKSKTNIDKTEDVSQQQNTTTNSNQNSTSNTATSNTSAGSTTSTQTGTQTSDSTKTNALTGLTSLFSDDILSGLEGTVKSLLGTVKPTTVTGAAFDPDAYVRGSVGAAESKSQDLLEATRGALGDSIGANPLNSSMGTLLLNRATSDAAAGVEGVRSQAQQTAAGIVNANQQLQLASGQQGIDMLSQLTQLLKGGTQATSQVGTEGTKGTTSSTQAGGTTTNESSQQNANTITTQTLQQIVDALLTGQTKTQGEEYTKNSGTTMGANLSLGGK